MTLAERAVSYAISQVGVKEEPPGSNRGPEVDEYIRSGNLDPAKGSYPWCACFVVHCVKRAGELLRIKPQLRASARVVTLLQRNPEAQLDRAEPLSIFIHLETNGDGHTGFVISVNEDGTIETVEGNTDVQGGRTGGQVMRHQRVPEYVNAYLRIS